MSKTLIFRPDKLLMLPYVLGMILVGLMTFVYDFYSNDNNSRLLLVLAPFVIWSLVTLIRYRSLTSERYTISDNSIQIQSLKSDVTISLVNITDAVSVPYHLVRFGKLGKIILSANDRQYALMGIRDASSTAAIIMQAVEAAIARQNIQHRPAFYKPPTHAAGTLELMNDLVGLWQQGMITDEEYQKEIARLKRDA